MKVKYISQPDSFLFSENGEEIEREYKTETHEVEKSSDVLALGRFIFGNKLLRIEVQ